MALRGLKILISNNARIYRDMGCPDRGVGLSYASLHQKRGGGGGADHLPKDQKIRKKGAEVKKNWKREKRNGKGYTC